MNPINIDRKTISKKINLINSDLKEKEINIVKETPNVNIDLAIGQSIPEEEFNRTLPINIKVLLPVIDKKQITGDNENNKYIYNLDGILEISKPNFKLNKLVNLCVFSIIENSRVPPILLYLLNKDEESNILYFPHFYTTNNILEEANKKVTILFKDRTQTKYIKVI